MSAKVKGEKVELLREKDKLLQDKMENLKARLENSTKVSCLYQLLWISGKAKKIIELTETITKLKGKYDRNICKAEMGMCY